MRAFGSAWLTCDLGWQVSKGYLTCFTPAHNNVTFCLVPIVTLYFIFYIVTLYIGRQYNSVDFILLKFLCLDKNKIESWNTFLECRRLSSREYGAERKIKVNNVFKFF